MESLWNFFRDGLVHGGRLLFGQRVYVVCEYATTDAERLRLALG